MTDKDFDKTIEHDTPEMRAETAAPAPTRANWGRRILIGGLALVAVGGAGAALAGGGWGGHGGFGGPRFGMMGGPGMGIERAFDAIDATAEQEKQIWAIIDGVRGEVRPMMRDFRDARQQVVALLSAPTVDAAAVEKLRAERIAAIDEASKKMSAAIVQAAGVLTPEQRAKLAVRFEEGGRW